MKLFTRAQREKLLANGARRGADHRPVVRLFNPTGAGTWLLTELDPDHPDDYGFGLADLGMGFPELGDIGIREIAEFRGPHGPRHRARPVFPSQTRHRRVRRSRTGRGAHRRIPDPSSTRPPGDPGPGAPPAPDGISRTAFRPAPVVPGAGRFRFRPDMGDLE